MKVTTTGSVCGDVVWVVIEESESLSVGVNTITSGFFFYCEMGKRGKRSWIRSSGRREGALSRSRSAFSACARLENRGNRYVLAVHKQTLLTHQFLALR